jgi:hypothetical protein
MQWHNDITVVNMQITSLFIQLTRHDSLLTSNTVPTCWTPFPTHPIPHPPTKKTTTTSAVWNKTHWHHSHEGIEWWQSCTQTPCFTPAVPLGVQQPGCQCCTINSSKTSSHLAVHTCHTLLAPCAQQFHILVQVHALNCILAAWPCLYNAEFLHFEAVFILQLMLVQVL